MTDATIYNLDGSQRLTKEQSLYMDALRFIINEDEDKANHALNAVRDYLLEQSHSSHFGNQHTEKLVDDLTVEKFFALYGDAGYGTAGKKHSFDTCKRLREEWPKAATHLWVAHTELLEMIADHVGKLGSEADQFQCVFFLDRTRDHFKNNLIQHPLRQTEADRPALVA